RLPVSTWSLPTSPAGFAQADLKAPVCHRRISKFERRRRAEILRVYGQFITKPKVWLIPAQANGLGSLCGIGISAESALHRHAADDGVEDDPTESVSEICQRLEGAREERASSPQPSPPKEEREKITRTRSERLWPVA